MIGKVLPVMCPFAQSRARDAEGRSVLGFLVTYTVEQATKQIGSPSSDRIRNTFLQAGPRCFLNQA